MNETERPQSSRLLEELRVLDTQLRQVNIRYAMIGGIAVNVHGFVRATRDLDFMLLAEDADAVHGLLAHMGYEPIDRRADIASYVRGMLRVDILFARRPISRGLLEACRETEFHGMKVPAISLEGLIGLKVQAFTDDPLRRLRDLTDIIELMKINLDHLDLEEVRSYSGCSNGKLCSMTPSAPLVELVLGTIRDAEPGSYMKLDAAARFDLDQARRLNGAERLTAFDQIQTWSKRLVTLNPLANPSATVNCVCYVGPSGVAAPQHPAHNRAIQSRRLSCPIPS